MAGVVGLPALFATGLSTHHQRRHHHQQQQQDVVWTIEVTPPLPYPPGHPLVSPIPERACVPLRPGYAVDLRDDALTAVSKACGS